MKRTSLMLVSLIFMSNVVFAEPPIEVFDSRYLKLDGTNQSFWTPTTSLVNNLNADLWDGYQFADYLNQPVKITSNPTFNSVSLTGNLTLPTTTSTAGIIYSGSNTFIHNGGADGDNVFVGIGAGNFTSTGWGDNVGVGSATLTNLTDGHSNTAVGTAALRNHMSGHSNVAVGAAALRWSYSGSSNNVAIGSRSLGFIETGSNNVAIGTDAGRNYNNTAGSGSIFIGYQAGSDELGSNKLYIANSRTNNLIYGEFDAGKIGINTTSPSAVLNLKGPLSSPLTGTVSVANLSPTVSGTGTAFTTELKVGDSIKIENEMFTISSIASDTSLILDSPYQGQTAWGLIAYRDPILMAIDNGDSANKLIVTRSGEVGIGAQIPTAILDVNGTTGYNQLRMRTPYTPVGTASTTGNTGDIAWDDDYIYIKTSMGWKRAALNTW